MFFLLDHGGRRIVNEAAVAQFALGFFQVGLFPGKLFVQARMFLSHINQSFQRYQYS